MIAVITMAEKEERKKNLEVQKAIVGYDPEKWMKTNVQLRDDDQAHQTFQAFALPPLIKGKHKFAYCQHIYKEIHAFLQEREWAPIQAETETGGTTWLELFILFDTAGYRTDDGQHVKDPEAQARAEKRRRKANNAKGKT